MAKVYVWNVKKFGKRIEGQKKIVRFGQPIPVGAIGAEQFEHLLETEQVIEKTVKAKKGKPKGDGEAKKPEGGAGPKGDDKKGGK